MTSRVVKVLAVGAVAALVQWRYVRRLKHAKAVEEARALVEAEEARQRTRRFVLEYYANPRQ